MTSKFERGDRVVIVANTKYSELLVGMTGTVKTAYENNIAVLLDDTKNKRSGYGYFYFTAKQLKHIDKGDEVKMEGNYSIATVKFLEGHNTESTHRYALYDDNVGIGDICVVKSAHHGLGIARIVDIEPKTNETITREIVCRCDFTAFERRQEARKRRAELTKMMQDRAAKLQETALYELLAKDDSEMLKLLTEFKGINV